MLSHESDEGGRRSNNTIIASKAKYLGSCLLPSPVELEVTVLLNPERIEIPELDILVPIEQISKAELIEGNNLPSQTVIMLRIVGATIEKDKPYVIIETGENSDWILFKFNDEIIAKQLVAGMSKAMEEEKSKERENKNYMNYTNS